ncbi:MAG TPA: hypothetical protein VK675_03805, partial [Candidatus Paceibacterota bacterium]|nr:hypothetical protein [Candidatus Paceibacterota bacterium]
TINRHFIISSRCHVYYDSTYFFPFRTEKLNLIVATVVFHGQKFHHRCFLYFCHSYHRIE